MIHAFALIAAQQCSSVVVQPNGTTLKVQCRRKPSPSPSPVPTPQPTETPTAAPTPTIAPTPSPTPSQSPTLYGCPLGAPWTTDVSQAAVLPNSAAMIQATIDAGGGGSFSVYQPTNETMNQANNSTPVVNVAQKVKWHSMAPQPYLPSFPIEPLSDGHLLVLQTDSCQYFELYQASYVAPTLSAYSGYSGPTQGWTRPPSGALSTATGIPIGFVAIRPEELAAGKITHALGWDAKAKTLGTTCVSPAAPTDCTDAYAYGGPPGEAANAMPYGAHARLKASINCSALSPNAATVCVALQTYGSFIFDTGCCGNVLVGVGTLPWTAKDASDLASVTQLSNFDVVP